MGYYKRDFSLLAQVGAQTYLLLFVATSYRFYATIAFDLVVGVAVAVTPWIAY